MKGRQTATRSTQAADDASQRGHSRTCSASRSHRLLRIDYVWRVDAGLSFLAQSAVVLFSSTSCSSPMISTSEDGEIAGRRYEEEDQRPDPDEIKHRSAPSAGR